MKLSVTHGIDDPERVRTVIEKAYDSYKKRLADNDPQLRWENDEQATVSFSVLSKKIEARFTIEEDEVLIEGDIPLLFRPFQGKIESVVVNEVKKWVAKAEAGEI